MNQTGLWLPLTRERQLTEGTNYKTFIHSKYASYMIELLVGREMSYSKNFLSIVKTFVWEARQNLERAYFELVLKGWLKC